MTAVNLLLSQARKIVIAVIGVTVLLVGAAMLVLPGPGWVVIFVGLAILATEFVWAKRLLTRAKQTAVNAKDKVFGSATAKDQSPSDCSAAPDTVSTTNDE